MSLVAIYALTSRPPPRPLRGLRVVACAPGLWAAVRPVDAPPPLDERALRAHDALARRVASAVGAALPTRFGSVVIEAELAELLAPRAPRLREALAVVDGRVQMTLRIFGRAVPRASDPSRADRGAGTRYLEAARRRATLPEIDPLREQLGELVRAERRTSHRTPPLIATVHHLIDRGDARRYLERARAHRGPVRVLASGPAPAYAFAPEAPR